MRTTFLRCYGSRIVIILYVRRATMTGGSSFFGKSSDPSATDAPERHLGDQFEQTDSKLITRFRDLESTADVANLLELPVRQLTYLLWRTPESVRYSQFEIAKRRGGVRQISAPNPSLKLLQRKLLHVLGLVARVRVAAQAFTAGRSTVTNAECHLRKRFVLNVDLKDFFPSIHFGRVRGMFLAAPYGIGERAATTLAQICCHDGLLPQGAPTSPIVSNMICARLDSELLRAARHHKCFYTRFSDDLTFSTSQRQFPPELGTAIGPGVDAEAGPLLRSIIEDRNGFVINATKTRLQPSTTRQEVTGITVNRRPNVRRRYSAQIRAMLHAWERHGYEAAESEFLRRYDTKHRVGDLCERPFEAVIWGKLAYLCQVRGATDSRYLKLRRWLATLNGEVFAMNPDAMGEYPWDVFICHASEDKETVVVPLSKALVDASVSVWVDQGEIRWGDRITDRVNEGLSKSRFVILVLSSAFMQKRWPEAEMGAVMSKEIRSGVTCALPLMHGRREVRDDILAAYPLLSDKHYLAWDPADSGRVVAEVKSLLSS